MIGLQGKQLTSARLTYRLLSDEDKPVLAKLLADAAVTKPAGFLPARSQEEFDAFFASLTQYNTGIAVLLDGALIGYIHVNRYRSDSPEFSDKLCVGTGFVIGGEYQRHGYGSETLDTVTRYLLNSFYACFADCFIGNDASRKTIERCGYRYIGEYTMYFDSLGEEKTCLSYVLRHTDSQT